MEARRERWRRGIRRREAPASDWVGIIAALVALFAYGYLLHVYTARMPLNGVAPRLGVQDAVVLHLNKLIKEEAAAREKEEAKKETPALPAIASSSPSFSSSSSTHRTPAVSEEPSPPVIHAASPSGIPSDKTDKTSTFDPTTKSETQEKGKEETYAPTTGVVAGTTGRVDIETATTPPSSAPTESTRHVKSIIPSSSTSENPSTGGVKTSVASPTPSVLVSSSTGGESPAGPSNGGYSTWTASKTSVGSTSPDAQKADTTTEGGGSTTASMTGTQSTEGTSGTLSTTDDTQKSSTDFASSSSSGTSRQTPTPLPTITTTTVDNRKLVAIIYVDGAPYEVPQGGGKKFMVKAPIGKGSIVTIEVFGGCRLTVYYLMNDGESDYTIHDNQQNANKEMFNIDAKLYTEVEFVFNGVCVTV